MDDLISLFMEYTKGSMSPELFRRWAGISLLAATCERRIWVVSGNWFTFPNLYTFLVAPPGVGKQVIDDAREFAYEVPGMLGKNALFVSPDSMTKASLIDELAKAKNIHLPRVGPPIEYHSLYVAAEEASILLPSYDLEFIGVLNRIYNNPKIPFEETRRYGKYPQVKIPGAQLNLLIGAQPGWMASVFPEEAWSTGLTARIMMIYCGEGVRQSLLDSHTADQSLKQSILDRLVEVSKLYGQAQWEENALEDLDKWHMAGRPPVPNHSKLEHYERRRTLHVTKLALVSGVSRTGKMTIGRIDVKRAMEWMFEIEHLMPDIFRAMVGRSDVQVIEELHYFVTSVWRMSGQKPVHERQLFNFLHSRVPSDKIERLINVSERSNIIERVAGTNMYLPKARHEHGME